MYKCMECGNLFEDGEEKMWREDMGEYFGSPCYMEMKGCPACGGAYDDVEQCKICGKYSTDYFCDECVHEVLQRYKEVVRENFTEDEIELLEAFD